MSPRVFAKSLANLTVCFFLWGRSPQNILIFYSFTSTFSDKKQAGKSKDEAMREKERELNERLQDVTGKLGSAKKVHRKGSYHHNIMLWKSHREKRVLF